MEPYTEATKAAFARQIADADEVVGELVSTSYDDVLLLTFVDGRWACYRWYAYPEGGGGIEFATDPPDFHTLHDAGILATADYQAQKAHEHEYYAERQRREELAQFERLRKKFAATPPAA